MRKSNKKIKSDRINALRKQYDSFLEEDKKRRERNEYILGKLDKMVYSNALVPTRGKTTSIVNRPSVIYQLPYHEEVSVGTLARPPTTLKHHLRENIPAQKLEETPLLQEVSKMYILIPKLTSPFMNNVSQESQPVYAGGTFDYNGRQSINNLKTNNVPQPSNDNNDWKSKYEILNILKKDVTQNQTATKCDSQRLPERLLNSTDNVSASSDHITSPDRQYNIDYKNIAELPEKDVSDEKKKYVPQTNGNSSECTTVEKPNQISFASKENPINELDNIGYELQNTKLIDGNYTENHNANLSLEQTYPAHEEDYNNIQQPTESDQIGEQTYYSEHPQDHSNKVDQEEYNYTEPQAEQPTSAGDVEQYEHLQSETDATYVIPKENVVEQKLENPVELDYTNNIENELYSEGQDFETIQVVNANEFVEEINDNHNDNHESENTTNEYQQVLNGIDEVTTKPELKMKSSHETEFDQTGNVNIADATVEQREVQDDEVAHEVAQIQEFDAEQREMFYTENPAEASEIQQDEGTYNQPMENYTENEQYPQNFNYYDNTLQQDMYPVDVAEDEEHLKLKYDQSYQQQYVDPYEQAYNKQPADYQVESEAYQPIPQDDIETVYDQKTYETPEQVEVALDNEDGYNAPAQGDFNFPSEEPKGPDSK